MKIAIVVGVRPEFIKMAPFIKLCSERKIEHFVIHTGQHYGEDMDKQFFDDFKLEVPDYVLNSHSTSPSTQIANMMTGMETVLSKNKPDLVLVYGDSNSALGPALACAKMNIPIGHVEAGLRSFDRTMPEEINRVVVDHISDLLFAPTDVCKNYLLQEGIDPKQISVTGNTVVDSIFYIKEISDTKSSILNSLKLSSKNYALLTLHRPSNVDDKERLDEILQSLKKICNEYSTKIVFPIHPRTKKNLDKFGLTVPDEIIVSPPLGYLDIIKLQNNAKVIFTDSGSIQEEACVLGIPCITIRDNTERPESIEVNANILVNSNFKSMKEAYDKQITTSTDWENPYGDGTASQKILKICLEKTSLKNL
jgi:UDP-N-acetylglucosamine 2-epimerase (non-hydrolysing)